MKLKTKNLFLYVTGFFCGICVMAIELGASRLMSPYFSSSQIIWTIIIGCIMIAMSIGNIIGGKMADKQHNPNILFILLLSAAAWTCLIPLVGKGVIAGVSGFLALFVTRNFLVWASFLSCLLVFCYPLLVLGMVTPNLVRFACDDLSNSGKVVGRIEALNTIGCIIGTFLPTFVTIPSIGTTLTFVLFGSILFIICIVYFFIKNSKTTQKVVSIILAVVFISVGTCTNIIKTAFWDNSIIVEKESIYNYLRVYEDEESIMLSTNVLFGVQSVKMKNKKLTSFYYDYALAAPVMVNAMDEQKDILVLGLGTGTFATQCKQFFNNPNVDGVEIDGEIVKLAKDYFDLPSSINTYIEDGRAYINRINKKYDVIMVDAYQDITIPFQMSSIEFFTKVKEHLKEDGIMVVNLNMYSEQETSINDYLASTIVNTFCNNSNGSVYLVKASSNIELFASPNSDILERLENNIPFIDDVDLSYKMSRIKDDFYKYTRNDLVLTDDKAPVELLGMSVLDEMISEELEYLKRNIKGKSIKEIISLFM